MTRSFILAKQWSIPKRFLSLTLFDGREGGVNSNKVLSWADINANVSFSTSASVYGMASEANITISGLTLDKMVYLSTSYTSWTENPIFNDVEIDAGYEGKHGLIYKGTIIEGKPNLNQANFSISLKCFSLYNTRVRDIVSLSYKGEKKVTEIVDEIADMIGFSPVYNESVRDEKINDYSLTDSSPEDHMKYIAKITGLDVFADKGRVVVKKKGESIEAFNKLKLDDTNIIGAPEPTPVGCNVTIKMDSSVCGGQAVELKSRRFPTLDSDKYFVSTYYHSGETKGNKWTTHLNLVRENIYESA